MPLQDFELHCVLFCRHAGYCTRIAIYCTVRYNLELNCLVVIHFYFEMSCIALCWNVFRGVVLCCSVLGGEVLYFVERHCIVLRVVVLCSVLLCSLCCSVLRCEVLYYIERCCIVLRVIILCCSVL